MSDEDIGPRRSYFSVRIEDRGCSRGLREKRRAPPVIKYEMSAGAFESAKDNYKHFPVMLQNRTSVDLYVTPLAFGILQNYAQNDSGSERNNFGLDKFG